MGGTMQAPLTLAASASDADDYYNGMTITTGGDGVAVGAIRAGRALGPTVGARAIPISMPAACTLPLRIGVGESCRGGGRQHHCGVADLAFCR